MKALIASFCLLPHALLSGLLPGSAANAATPADNGDWPAFRGPQGDNHVAWLPEALPAEAKPVWTRPLEGSVFSGVVVSTGRVIVMDHEAEKQDFIRCFKADSGEPLWSTPYPNTGDPIDWGSNPRATPVVADGMVFSLGARGQLLACDLETGAVRWQHDLVKDFGAEVPMWGYSASPRIHSGKLIVCPGGAEASCVALDPKTGKTLWSSKGAAANYGSPMIATVEGKAQIIGFDQDNITGRSLEDGSVIWSRPVMGTGYLVPSPVIVGDSLVQASDSQIGLQKLNGKGELPDTWIASSSELAPGDSTPTAAANLLLFCSDNSGLSALDLEDGLKTAWTYTEDESLSGFATILAAGQRALVLDSHGMVHLFSVDAKKATPLGKFKACADTRVGPALVGDRLYVRDDKTVSCYLLPAAGAPAATTQQVRPIAPGTSSLASARAFGNGSSPLSK